MRRIDWPCVVPAELLGLLTSRPSDLLTYGLIADWCDGEGHPGHGWRWLYDEKRWPWPKDGQFHWFPSPPIHTTPAWPPATAYLPPPVFTTLRYELDWSKGGTTYAFEGGERCHFHNRADAVAGAVTAVMNALLEIPRS